MDPKSEVVLRQRNYLKGRVLFIHAPADRLVDALAPDVQAVHWTWNFSDHQAHLAAQMNSIFSVEFPDQKFDQVVIFVPKSKTLLEYVLHQVAAHLDAKQQVFLVGEKKAGIERAAKQLLRYGKSLKLDSARHCQMWQMSLEQRIDLIPLQRWVKSYYIPLQSETLEICALPGVFSQDHLDIGTAQLLPFLDQVKSGTLGDFGCGAGIISCYLAKINSANIIHALDVDAFALKSTALTFERNGIPTTQLNLHAVTGIQDAPLNLDALISNPPFHQGIQTDYDASENLCRRARAHLKPKGELWIVANRFLNYTHLLEQQFGQVSIKTDKNGFKVIHAY